MIDLRRDAVSSGHPTWRWGAAAATAVTLARLAFGLNRRIVQFYPDEIAFMAMARWLSGRGTWNMFDLPTWAPGFSVLLAPAYWITSDPSTVFRIALLLNSVIAGISVLVLADVLSYLVTISRRRALVVAAAVAVAPASIGASAAAWAEPLVTLTFLLTVRSAFRFASGFELRHGVMTIVWAFAAANAHGRMLPLAAAATGAVLVVMARRRSLRQTVTASVAAGLLLVGTVVFTAVVVDRVWEVPEESHTVGAVLKRLLDPIEILESAIGQTWYQLASTFGIVGVGAVRVVRLASERQGPARRQARLLLTCTIPLVLLSVVFMAGRARIDQNLYGRYNDAILWPILAVGVCWLIDLRLPATWRSLRPLVTAIGALFATGAFVQLRLAPRFDDATVVPDMIAGVIWQSPITDPLGVIEVTLVSMGVATIGLLALARRSDRVVVGVVAAAIVVVGAVRVHQIVGRAVNAFDSSSLTTLDRELLLDAGHVGFRFVPDSPFVTPAEQALHAQLYQWHLPDVRFVRDNGPDDDVGPFVFAPLNDPDQFAAGSTVVWMDTDVALALWREPTTPAP